MKRPLFRGRMAAWTVAAQGVVVIAMLVALGGVLRHGASQTWTWILYGCMAAEPLVSLPLAPSGLKRLDKNA